MRNPLMSSSTFWANETRLNVAVAAVDDEQSVAHERIESFWGMFSW